jgi:3'-phosphoadenosine 5'-phosphosulfate sulfotransferase (PAPS reductase)/FAD synthetase
MAGEPDLGSYDVILVNSSAGKDSQCMLDVVVERARALGVVDRVVVVHADLGRVEWEGTRELAEEQASAYGLRFIAVKRPQGDLLDHVRARRKWPASNARYCTSDHKRGQVRKVMTSLAAEVRERTGKDQARILNCLGIRAQESPARAKRPSFQHDRPASNGRRHVDTWHPIHHWTVDEVWARIRQSGVPHHRAYDLGMPRLSCCFCIFAPKAALVVAGRHNRALLEEYVRTEDEIGHTFRKSLPIAEVLDAVEAGEACGEVESWDM